MFFSFSLLSRRNSFEISFRSLNIRCLQWRTRPRRYNCKEISNCFVWNRPNQPTIRAQIQQVSCEYNLLDDVFESTFIRKQPMEVFTHRSTYRNSSAILDPFWYLFGIESSTNGSIEWWSIETIHLPTNIHNIVFFRFWFWGKMNKTWCWIDFQLLERNQIIDIDREIHTAWNTSGPSS